nr:hypothetical protein HmN_000771000 [Hymenolepis microstoma]
MGQPLLSSQTYTRTLEIHVVAKLSYQCTTFNRHEEWSRQKRLIVIAAATVYDVGILGLLCCLMEEKEEGSEGVVMRGQFSCKY